MESELSPTEACPVRKRISTACEACRATKIKCQPSEQPGVCRKCLESKKECISRTGPRTRRRRTKHAIETHQPPPPPPPAPSKTFTIDFEVPTPVEVDENFESLRDSHTQFIDSMFPSDGEETDLSIIEDSPLTSFPTPSSSHTHSIQSLHAKPQFNLDSAESLLVSFRGMLVHYPCIGLRSEETVATLAATKPFVLLAILAAASGSRTLQGHTLYDEEFRKVLGLKFVAGGERSMELFQGILIYCAWYPFHLRPKNKQAFQYYRMAGDLMNDLELDQEVPHLSSTIPGEMTSSQLDRLRAYLAYHYAVSKYVHHETHQRQFTHTLGSFMFKKMENMVPPWTPWTDACCDLLQRHAEVDGDVSLSYLVKLANMTSTVNDSIQSKETQANKQVQLVLLGLETQHKEMKEAMVPHISRSAPVKLAHLFFDVFLQGGAIFYLTRSNTKKPSFVSPSPNRLIRCVHNIRALFDHLMNPEIFLCFTSVDWTKFILSIILAIRLSFPITDVPDWDHAWARSHLRFDEFLELMSESPEDLTPASKRVDVLSASRVILRIVKAKYDRRIAVLTASSLENTLGHQGCPMFDKDMQPYLSAWDTGFDINSVFPAPNPNLDGQQPMYHDLWATMTMSWANEDGTMDS